MTYKEIIKSGFVERFISEYVEYYIYTVTPTKRRLLYSLCSDIAEKKLVTSKLIAKTKKRIKNKCQGIEEIIGAIVIESSSGTFDLNFWITRMAEEFADLQNSFSPITEYSNKFLPIFRAERWGEEESLKGFDEKLLLHLEEYSNEFWSIFKPLKPKISHIPKIIEVEEEIEYLIESDIEEFRKKEYSEFDFDEFNKYKKYSLPIKDLLRYSKLFVLALNLTDSISMIGFLDRREEEEEEAIIQRVGLKQIALKCFYDGVQITRKNGKEIAKKHGYSSGDKLYQNYSRFSSRTNRISTESTKNKTKIKIKLLESVINLIDEKGRENLINDISILRERIKEEFYL